MQDTITQSELHSTINSKDDLAHTSLEQTPSQVTEPVETYHPTDTLKDEAPLAGASSSIPLRASRSQHSATMSFSPSRRGPSSALIAGAIAGVLSALLTILIILVNTGTFHTASLQIAVDRLTVKTALALA